MPTFVPVVSVKSAQVNKATHERRPACIEIVMGIIVDAGVILPRSAV
jgi:hypothetical protein